MHFVIYQDSQRFWRWRLTAVNGRIIADSGEAYVNRVDALRGIDLVKLTNDTTPVYQ